MATSSALATSLGLPDLAAAWEEALVATDSDNLALRGELLRRAAAGCTILNSATQSRQDAWKRLLVWTRTSLDTARPAAVAPSSSVSANAEQWRDLIRRAASSDGSGRTATSASRCCSASVRFSRACWMATTRRLRVSRDSRRGRAGSACAGCPGVAARRQGAVDRSDRDSASTGGSGSNDSQSRRDLLAGGSRKSSRSSSEIATRRLRRPGVILSERAEDVPGDRCARSAV